MSKQITELLDTVVDNDYCIGCGVCASIEGSPLSMKMDKNGKYVPYIAQEKLNETSYNIVDVCPFAENNNNETEIGKELFGEFKNIEYDDYSGYYLKAYAGYVKEGSYREDGGSGGMGNWIAAKLLEKNLVDGIIHVKEANQDDSILFKYEISNNINELSDGAKSKYYPIELSQVLQFVRENEGHYALIGIPCYIKGVRLLEKKDPIIKQRIKFHIGLVCGHLKSEMFAKSIGWQLGIKPEKLNYIDFRKKLPNRPANQYGVEVGGGVDDTTETYVSPTRELYTTNWGYGFFKYNACEFCDDILAETADITLGDAWLPEYANDSKGTNIIVIRNPIIQKIFDDKKEAIHLEEIGSEKVYQSQAGGFRHRRDGLAYRLYNKDKDNEWRPNKRVKPSNIISKKRKLTYEKRTKLSNESFNAYKIALEKGDFQELINYMDPLINEYRNIIKPSLSKRALSKIKRKIKRIILK